MFILSEKPINPEELTQYVSNEAAGAVVSFVGTVRHQTQNKPVIALDFEAYKPMAIKKMAEIAETAKARFSIQEVGIQHRLGRLEVGEVAVVIAVSAPHRKAAFAACEFLIDTLKEVVPIWKKEIFEDGEVWVSAHP